MYPLQITRMYCIQSLALPAVNRQFINKSQNVKNYSNSKISVLLTVLMCSLQITNDIDSLSLTLPAINGHFIY